MQTSIIRLDVFRCYQPTNQLLTAGSLSYLGFIVLPVALLVTSGDEIVLKSEHLMEIRLISFIRNETIFRLLVL